jgi:hypothetical protein
MDTNLFLQGWGVVRRAPARNSEDCVDFRWVKIVLNVLETISWLEKI